MQKGVQEQLQEFMRYGCYYKFGIESSRSGLSFADDELMSTRWSRGERMDHIYSTCGYSVVHACCKFILLSIGRRSELAKKEQRNEMNLSFCS